MREKKMVYDIIVVGAGPAGSVAAYTASRLGFKVALIEREAKGRDKYCGGGISKGALDFLVNNVSKEVRETAETEPDGFVVFSPSNRTLISSFYGYQGILVRRSVFDAKLMELAENAGAEFFEKTAITSLSKKDGYVALRTSGGEEFLGRYIIVATGVWDSLGEKAGIPKLSKEQFGHCWGTEASFPVDSYAKYWREELGVFPIFIFFGPVKSGYAWFFPKANHMNFGIGTTLVESSSLGGKHATIFNNVLENAVRLGVFREKPSFNIDRSLLIPFSSKPRQTLYSLNYRMLLVGDAAGFVHPVTGEGIYGAVVSGWLAAHSVREAEETGEISRLAGYEEKVWEKFGRDMFHYGGKLAKLLYSSRTGLEIGLRGIMEDGRAVRLLAKLLGHADEKVSEEMYNYVLRNIPSLAIKAILAKKVKKYV